jgi:hypothetical protein
VPVRVQSLPAVPGDLMHLAARRASQQQRLGLRLPFA